MLAWAEAIELAPPMPAEEAWHNAWRTEPRGYHGRWVPDADVDTPGGMFRRADPDDYSGFSYPDYKHRGGLQGLAARLKRDNPAYYQALHDDIKANGVRQPILVRYRVNGTGRLLPKPVVMDGHHRAAVAYQLGQPVMVGDYDDDQAYTAAMDTPGSSEWLATHHELKDQGGAPWRTEREPRWEPKRVATALRQELRMAADVSPALAGILGKASNYWDKGDRTNTIL